LDASNVLEKQRACSALYAVSLGTGCILQGFETKKHEVITSGSDVNSLTRFLHNPIIITESAPWRGSFLHFLPVCDSKIIL
jgi:hypothetical protein